ncbi:hypothetical protein [Kitasatospora sp. NPDC059327]|uniref:hypothetical protein n=1 Tax=Kitasatospora sp. NPDC059327 TaxID=3346803 RepID=UPI0036C5C67B
MTAAQPEPPSLVAATSMFIEVLVVGIGFLSGIAVLAAAAAGPHNTAKVVPVASNSLAAGAALAAAYALGIVVDRAADSALAPVRRRLRVVSFTTDRAYAQARLMLAKEPALAARADYARSRMRICRGWVVNSILLTLATDAALLRYRLESRPLLVILATVTGALATTGFYFTWRAITKTAYRKLAEQSVRPAPLPAQALQGNQISHTTATP